MSRTILITGFSGFVASHFVEYIYNNDPEYNIVGIDINPPTFDYSIFKDKLQIVFHQVNLLNTGELYKIFSEVMPEYVLHLAAFSSVAYSWKHPEESFKNNSNIFLNLIQVVKELNPDCKVLSVGSSEEYGNVAHENVPIRENQEINPISPYAVARVSQEMLSKVYVDAYGMNIIMTRSFNHIGPRQSERFVVPSFINRILDLKDQGNECGEIETGNLEIIRDFVDVRDVVRAYWLLLQYGTPGEIYNICSGKGIKLADIVRIVADKVGVNITTRVNPEYVRPNDNMEIVGSCYKIESELGWKPTREIEETICDMILYYEKERKGHCIITMSYVMST